MSTFFHNLKSKFSPSWTRAALFFSIMGPGIITANVDNDAGGITTYSQAGAQFGLTLLWIFIPMTIALIMVQEMTNRMGVVTNKGLSDLIREQFGVKWTFYLMVALLLTNFGNIIAEFSGIAAAGEIIGISKWISVPVAAILVWALVIYGNYARIEKVFLFATLFYLAYIITGVYISPDWNDVGTALITPVFSSDKAYLLMAVGLIGTTIAPWMQFYQQASVVEKNIPLRLYKYSRMDTVFGGITVSVVALFIVVVCANTLYLRGMPIETAGEAAQALAPLAGKFASLLFAIGLLNASLFAASVLPMSTSYTICEAFGWESGLNHKFSQAKQFYGLYTALIVIGAGIVLLPNLPLITVMYLSQVVNGMVLPFILIPMLILINNKKLMGDYVNGRIYNFLSWAMVIIVISLSVLSLWFTFFTK